MTNGVVEEEPGEGFKGVIEGGHSFYPLSKIINCNNGVFVAIVEGRLTLHKIDAPFAKWVYGDDQMMWSRWCSSFSWINLTICTMIDCSNAVLKE